MAVSLNVKSNIREFTKHLNSVQKKQIPFATAVSLTRTVKNIQAAEVGSIRRIFNNKKKWYVKGSPIGIRVITAKKATLTARVYTEALFGDLQEGGGIKKAFSGKALLIPMREAQQYARKSGGHTKVFNNKKTLKKRKKGDPKGINTGGFFFEVKGGKTLVLQRRTKKAYPLKAIYNVEKTANIKPRMKFIPTAEMVATRRFRFHFPRELSKAIARG